MFDPSPMRRLLREVPTGGRCRAVLLPVVLASAFLPYPLLAIQVPASTTPAVGRASTPDNSGAHAQQQAEVRFAAGLLTVIANNASLNGILREVAHQTGMKVTGSVAEDRVFGTYGPADPQRVLATLLDGTGSNFLIRSSEADAPVQLVLTRRTGAPSPPSANSASSRDTDDDQPQPPPLTAPGNNTPRARASALPGSVPPNPAATQPSATDQTVVFPPVDSSSTPATATTTPSDPNTPADTSTDSVKTPQQIFEQLQRLRQQGTGNTTQPQ